ncbi:MAG: AbrB/MazE/SpoVT family DNA-binding domain-containing protein [Anaerolineae bacterium]|nr:AbrB/MazE/SpoVT family DNA-binding domain-containing protein [Anaerolineae bacterium]
MPKAYTLQENGQVTLPAEWREKHGLKKGDLITFIETEEGLLVQPREVVAMRLLDKIGQALKERGIELDELIEDGRDIREELIRERRADKDA